MAVLVEGISVVVRVEAIIARYVGGLEAFKSDVPNNTLCIDNELARVGFMSPMDVESYVRRLESKGLRFLVQGEAVDIAVVDQLRGLTATCGWLEVGNVELKPGQAISAARLKGSVQRRLWTPDGWTWEESLSGSSLHAAEGDDDPRFKFLRTENELDVYLDQATGKQVYRGRTIPRDRH